MLWVVCYRLVTNVEHNMNTLGLGLWHVRECLRQPGRVSCDLGGTECAHLSVRLKMSPRFSVSHLCDCEQTLGAP